MTQTALPDADISAGSWTIEGGPSTLFDALDDGMASDTEFLEDAAADSTFEVGIEDLVDPENNVNHVIRVRLQGNWSGEPERLIVALVEGTTVIQSSGNLANRASWLTTTFTIGTTEADTIGDYTDLRLRGTAANLVGGETMWVSGLQFEVDDAPVGGDPVHVVYRRPNPLLRM